MSVDFRGQHSIRGLTLAETLISASVMTAFLILALGAVVPGLRITRQAEQSLAAQREVVLMFDRLVAEMSLMDRATVTVGTGALSYLSHKPYTGPNAELPDIDLDILNERSPDVDWQKFVLLRMRDGNLMRREYLYTKGEVLARILPAELLGIADSGGIAEKIFAKNVEEFETFIVGASRVAIRIRSVQRETSKPEACEMTLQLTMRGTL